MKKILCVLMVALVMSSAHAAFTIYGGVSKFDDSDLGFTAGMSLFKDSGLQLGLDASYSRWGDSATILGISVDSNLSIIEIMPMIRFGDQLFIAVGAGLEIITRSIDIAGGALSASDSSVEVGIGGDLGYKLGSLEVKGRLRIIDGDALIGGLVGISF